MLRTIFMVGFFALLGLSQLMLCVASIVVMIRYRALVPFMFALLLVYHLGRQVVLVALPIVRTGAPPGAGMNVALLTALLVGFALSRWSRGEPQAVG